MVPCFFTPFRFLTQTDSSNRWGGSRVLMRIERDRRPPSGCPVRMLFFQPCRRSAQGCAGEAETLHMNSCRKKPNIIVVCGPTGIGKTTTAIELALAYRGEIISADSMQIYRHMDIGTAKPTPEERAAVPHHMIDIAAPDEPFDAARFAREAREKIAVLTARMSLPFIAGGTGLYIKSLTQGSSAPKPPTRNAAGSLKKRWNA